MKRLLSLASALLVSLALSSCGSDEGATTASTDPVSKVDIALAGSVGDGPIVNANITVRSRTGQLLSTAVSNQKAGYNIELQARRRDFPVSIEARGGTDLVTHRAPDFTLLGAGVSASGRATVNLNPFGTLAVATAKRMRGGVTAENIAAALETVVAQFHSGLPARSAFDPMYTRIDDGNLAMIVKASEALAEILRRTHAAAVVVYPRLTVDRVVGALAADLVDGKLDGRGVYGSRAVITAASILASAQVLVEAMSNELRVDTHVVTPVLDDVIARLAEGSAPPLTAQQRVTAGMIDHASKGIAAAKTLAASASLDALQAGVAKVGPGMLPSEADGLLPQDAFAALAPALSAIGNATTESIGVVIALRNGGQPQPGPEPEPEPEPEPTPNSAPVISGTPPTTAISGSRYQFVPTARDQDGEVLTFQIQNRPAWASFNTATGALSGTPSDAHVGVYSSIVITVTDGLAADRLAPFDIRVEAFANGTATLSWGAPTERTDGTPLENLAGYRVYWGTSPGDYTGSFEIDNPSVTLYVVGNLGRGTYYFATTAVDAKGVESGLSNETSATIP